MTGRWLFADQLGPQYLDAPDQPALLVESQAVFRRRRFHRAKAHLLLSALRHRAAELSDTAVFLRADTYDEALGRLGAPLTVVQPTSYAGDRFVRERGIPVLPTRGFATTREDFGQWADGRRRLLLEDFYRWQRVRLDLLMDGSDPAAGRWNYDHDNGEPPPRTSTLGVTGPWEAVEDDVDAKVRADLDRWQRDGEVRFVGEDGPAVGAGYARGGAGGARPLRQAPAAALRADRGRHARRRPLDGAQRAVTGAQPRAAAPPGVLQAAELAYRQGRAPLASVEGYVRQVIGWREYVWSTYWHFPRDYRRRNALQATAELPEWFRSLDAGGEVTAHCLSSVLGDLRRRGWVHHIPRLMVLGNYALQRGWDPAQLTAWFHEAFVDGYDWVMLPNVTGMSQHADGGLMTTKPYAAGGAYISRMSDYCGGCAYDPKVRVGPTACPYSAGYWAFLDRNAERLTANPRMRQPLAALERLKDRHELVTQERERGDAPP